MVSVVLEVIRGALKGAKREDLAKALTVEGLSEFAVAKVRDLLDRNTGSDGRIRDVPHEDIKKLVNEEPAVVGGLVALAANRQLSASSERDHMLDLYAEQLNDIVRVAVAAETSLALRGFLHDGECISYWRFKGATLGTNEFRRSGDELRLDGAIEVYLSNEEPNEEVLRNLNEQIRLDRRRQLPATKSDYFRNDQVALVRRISEGYVYLDQLDPNRLTEATESLDPFGLDKFPKEYMSKIPVGAPALDGLVTSIAVALEVQQRPLLALRETIERIKSKVKSE